MPSTKVLNFNNISQNVLYYVTFFVQHILLVLLILFLKKHPGKSKEIILELNFLRYIHKK